MESRKQHLKIVSVWGTVLRQNVLWSSLLTTTSFFLGACAFSVPMTIPTQLPIQKASAKLPVTVGFYHAPEFRTHEEHVLHMGLERYVFPLGAASVSLFEQVMPLVFGKVMPVQGRPPLADPVELYGVIEPRIESFNLHFPGSVWGTHSVEISYRVILYDKTGIPVISWVVSGIGEKRGEFGFYGSLPWAGQAADLALQDVGRKFLEDFSRQPEVKIWLQKIR